MLPSFAMQTVTILTAATVADHGAQVADWSTPTETVESGWLLQPLTSTEVMENRNAVQAQWRGHGPADSSVTATSRVRFNGQDFEVVGEPLRWPSPTGALAHTEVLLSRWEG